MTADVDVQIPPFRDDAWEGFETGPWTDGIDVRDFILRNFTPYVGDATFLAGPTVRTLTVWETLQRDFLSVERERRVFELPPAGPRQVDRTGAGLPAR